MSEDCNECDKCGEKFETTSLIWLTSDDFEPFESDGWTKKKHKEATQYYDALCEDCYLEVFKKGELL